MFLLFDASTIELVIYTLAAILPGIVLLSYIYKRDSVEKEPPKLLLKLFLVGALSALLAAVLEGISDVFVLPNMSIGDNVFVQALAIGLIEEGSKLFLLYKSSWKSSSFNYCFDGVVYAVFVSLGFAVLENILYVFMYGLGTAVVRAITAVPGHMGFAVFMGTYYGKAKVHQVREEKDMMRHCLAVSYILAVVLHAAYDAMAMISTDLSMMLFVVFVCVMYYVVYHKIKRESFFDTPIY